MDWPSMAPSWDPNRCLTNLEGQNRVAALAGSPHILPYYLLVLLWEVGLTTGTGSGAPAETQTGGLP